MKLHIFNPEHDIALAHGSPYFTAPKAGRWLRRDCGFLPLLWASEDDAVLVDDVDSSRDALSYAFKDVSGALEGVTGEQLVTLSDLSRLPVTEVCPWGWDAALTHQLRCAGVGEPVLPAVEVLNAVRELSHRRTAARLLSKIVQVDRCMLIGNALEINTIEALNEALVKHDKLILKAPWSSSGRGLMRVEGALDAAQVGWVQRVLRQQGALMVEPIYNKVADFGMEFVSTGQEVVYGGLSVFNTVNGAYTGNVLATEREKTALLTSYVDERLLLEVREAVCKYLNPLLRNIYRGLLGVDMMIVRTGNALKLHPMVEINLRRTMGHVAIALAGRLAPRRGHMRIVYADGRYRLSVETEN